MVMPCRAERPITCPFKKKGSSWSTGEHSGIDWGTPGGDPVYAMWGGKVTGSSWGSAYGTHIVIDHDSLPSGDPGLWAIYAHLKSKTVSSGDRVEAGDLIGYSNNTGNSSGNHLHTEIQPQSTWVKGSYRDPMPWVEAGGTSSTYYVTGDVYRSKCGYGEPSNGDANSNTVKELQERLNHTSLVGGQNLEVTGVYDDDTDEEVRLWQDQICGDAPDPVGGSYLGPSQFKKMFPDSIYSLHDDGDPAIATDDGGTGGEEPPPSTAYTTLGKALMDAGFVVHDADVPYGRESTWRGVDFLMVHHTGPYSTAEGMANYIRNGGSGTYPPLSQIMLDDEGEVWMCSKERSGQEAPGRASHAGNGDGYGVPDDSMNEYSLGIECLNAGDTPLASNPKLYDSLIRLLYVLSDIFGVSEERIIGHKEWSNTGKVDPLDDMDDIRADVVAYVEEEPPPVTTPPPVDPDTEPVDPVEVGSATYWHAYSGKPSGELTIDADDGYVAVDATVGAAPISGHEEHMLYANLNLTWSGSSLGEIRVKYVRSDGDATAYQDFHVKNGEADFLVTHIHFESGQKGIGGKWYINVGGGISRAKVGTRYVKTHAIAVDPVTVSSAAVSRPPVLIALLITLILAVAISGLLFG